MKAPTVVANAASRGPRFDELRGGHDAHRSAEETLTLAAMAALNGLYASGEPFTDARGAKPATISAIARELGQHVGAARRGVAGNVANGEAYRDGDGYRARPEALARRWADYRRRISLDKAVRCLGLRAAPLLVAGLVRGQVDKRGRLVLGMGFLCERLGIARRCLFRHLAACEHAGALHRWVAPLGRGQLIMAPGPSRSGTRDEAAPVAHGGRREAAAQPSQSGTRDSDEQHGDPCREAAPVPVAKRHRSLSQSGTGPCREAAPHLSRSGTRHPDCTRTTPGSPPEAPRGETTEQQQQQQQQNQTAPAARRQSPGADDVRGAAGRWAADMVARGTESLTADHAADVARLLEELGPLPGEVRDPARLAADRLKAGARIATWSRSPERLARWVAVAARRYGPRNVAGYLRRAADRGDPGALLERHAGGAGALQELHEAALQGDRSADVAELVDAIVEPPRAAVEPAPTPAARPPQAFDERARRVVVARAFGDRHPLARIADELGVAVGVVEAIVADERARRAEDAAGAPAPRRSAPARLGLARSSLAATRAS